MAGSPVEVTFRPARGLLIDTAVDRFAGQLAAGDVIIDGARRRFLDRRDD
jgi:6-phosphogluconate dehydrogenase (decarboxylating)